MSLYAQMPGAKDMSKIMKDIRGRAYGKIRDAQTRKPVPFATISVLWFNKDSIIGGALSGENGEFSVEDLPAMGGFRYRISQIGYKTLEGRFFVQMPNKIEVDLGDFMFEIDSKLLQEVEVVAQKGSMGLSIDKRDYYVDKDISVRGGTAVDVMKNVPGVSVDADGNAQLRNQSPIIFVDGRPSNLTLQQIPADQIERVEIITNPSVKYDAAATGGILNIILKKNLKPGYNGMLMANTGTNDRYGSMLNLNIKEGRWNLSLMHNYMQAFNDTRGSTNRTQLSNNDTLGYYILNTTTRMFNRFQFGKIGLEYMLNNRNSISANVMFMGGTYKTTEWQFYQLQDSAKNDFVNGNRQNLQNAQFGNTNAQLYYRKTFPKAGEEWTADLNYNQTQSQNGFTFASAPVYTLPQTVQNNTGKSAASQMVFQSDYVKPIDDSRKFEAGVKLFLKSSDSQNNASLTIGSNQPITDSSMSNRYLIDERISAAYINYNTKLPFNIGTQMGLRFEESYYAGQIPNSNQSFSYHYPIRMEDLSKSLFPGIYFSKKISGGQEWQLNFSRKIQRPNFFQLMPFVMFADKQNYRIGNPQLKPEFRNISEINYNKVFERSNYLGSLYARYEEQPITEIAYPSPDNPSVLVNTSTNGKDSWRYGSEHTFKTTWFNALDVMLNANVFYIYLKGQVIATDPTTTVEQKGYSFGFKSTLTYRLPGSKIETFNQWSIQLNAQYDAPRILLLGYSQPIYGFDLSFNKMIGTTWIINATLSDVLNSRIMGFHYETPYYVQDLSRRREARFFRLSISYIFGKMDASIFKKAKQLRSMGEGQGGNQDGLDFSK